MTDSYDTFFSIKHLVENDHDHDFRNMIWQMLQLHRMMPKINKRLDKLEKTVEGFRACDDAWDEEKEFYDWCNTEDYKKIIERLDKLEKGGQQQQSAPTECPHDSWIVDGIPPLHKTCGKCGKVGDPNDAPESKPTYHKDDFNEQDNYTDEFNKKLREMKENGEYPPSENPDILHRELKFKPYPIFTEEFLPYGSVKLNWVSRDEYDKMLDTNNQTIIRHLNRIMELKKQIDGYGKTIEQQQAFIDELRKESFFE